jgi:hypothetical protein
MIDKELVQRGVEALKNPHPYTKEQEDYIFALIVAGSQRLSGIPTTTPDKVLEAAKEFNGQD